MKKHKLYNLNEELIDTCDERPYGFTGIVHYCDGDVYWYFEGNAHRFEGSAALKINGDRKFYIYGEEYTKQQHKLLVDTMKLKGLL